MLKNNKWKIVISSILVLLPILFGLIMWEKLPDMMNTHWGADGKADGFASKAFAVFGLPCILLLFHFVALLATMLDKQQKAQSAKVLSVVLWIFPMISLIANSVVYRAAFGVEINMGILMPLVMGAMFLIIGNYLPKVKQNSTLGIKLSWTLNNEENWNKTHRFAGRVWVIGGVGMLLCTLLPLKLMVWVTLALIAIMVTLPVACSYRIYKQHKEEGVAYGGRTASKTEKIAVKLSAVVTPVILLGVVFLMFTGNVQAQCQDDGLHIQATYWEDIRVDYDEIETVTYRQDLDVGVRTGGWGSARLMLGLFENDEFGRYTLYSYTGAKEFVVLTSGEKTLVIGLQTAEETQQLYESLISR